jgi:hypothetical protein
MTREVPLVRRPPLQRPNPFWAYERAKAELDREQPNLTPAQRDAALRAIAKRLGV